MSARGIKLTFYRTSFLKKRSKKLLRIAGYDNAAAKSPMSRGFLLLFFKTEALA
jgi:hypothetical protein